MKLMIRRTEKGLSAYAPKKDLEEPIVAVEKATLWGGWVKLKNGWVLALPSHARRYAASDHSRSTARR